MPEDVKEFLSSPSAVVRPAACIGVGVDAGNNVAINFAVEIDGETKQRLLVVTPENARTLVEQVSAVIPLAKGGKLGPQVALATGKPAGSA